MANRTRKVQLKFWVTEEERAIIERKMEMLKTKNMGAYLRKMAIDGYIIQVDYTEQKKLAAAVNKIGTNINNICRRMNSTGRFYQDDVVELKGKLDEVWQLLSHKKLPLTITVRGLHYRRSFVFRARYKGRLVIYPSLR